MRVNQDFTYMSASALWLIKAVVFNCLSLQKNQDFITLTNQPKKEIQINKH
jgi:hypothetical protein